MSPPPFLRTDGLRKEYRARVVDGGDTVVRALDGVTLTTDRLDAHPDELSGGERQRVGIARAIATRPRFVVADEPVAALDAPIQGRILNCLRELRRELSLTMLFVSHDLAVVSRMADRVAVMDAGCIVEAGSTAAVFTHPEHPQTRRLLARTQRL